MTDKEMKMVCAWCSKHLSGPEDGEESHGICKPCADKLVKEYDEDDRYNRGKWGDLK